MKAAVTYAGSVGKFSWPDPGDGLFSTGNGNNIIDFSIFREFRYPSEEGRLSGLTGHRSPEYLGDPATLKRAATVLRELLTVPKCDRGENWDAMHAKYVSFQEIICRKAELEAMAYGSVK